MKNVHYDHYYHLFFVCLSWLKLKSFWCSKNYF